MKIIIIAAMTRDRVIGQDGQVPWHDPADLRHFKRTTMGHAVIMGRKTYDSVGKPLPGRRNIVITRNVETSKRRNAETPEGKRPEAAGQSAIHNPQPAIPEASLEFVSSLEEALELCRSRGEPDVFIAGGGQIYAQALRIADEMIITWIAREGVTGDTFFPAWDAERWAADPKKSPERHQGDGAVQLRSADSSHVEFSSAPPYPLEITVYKRLHGTGD